MLRLEIYIFFYIGHKTLRKHFLWHCILLPKARGNKLYCLWPPECVALILTSKELTWALCWKGRSGNILWLLLAVDQYDFVALLSQRTSHVCFQHFWMITQRISKDDEIQMKLNFVKSLWFYGEILWLNVGLEWQWQPDQSSTEGRHSESSRQLNLMNLWRLDGNDEMEVWKQMNQSQRQREKFLKGSSKNK